jgi:RNA polymerase sigma-70 factor, ECF subfamily
LSNPIAPEDQHDIEGTLAGDDLAFARLVGRYQEVITAQMWRFTRDPIILEELIQDVFVEAYRSLKNYKGKAPFLHWLRRIATRVGYRHWKQNAREQKRRESLELNREELAMTGSPKTPSRAAELLHEVLAQLKPNDRLVLTLHYLEGCSTAEIADWTGWSRAAVKVRAFRARKKLKEMLEKLEIRGVENV